MRAHVTALLLVGTACGPSLTRPRATADTGGDPIAVTVMSMRWDAETPVDVSEGGLMSLIPSDVAERITVDHPVRVAEFARLYERLRPTRTPALLRDFRIEALLIWRSGAVRRVGVPSSCLAMTRDGQAVAFDRELYEWMVSRLSEKHRSALGGECRIGEH